MDGTSTGVGRADRIGTIRNVCFRSLCTDVELAAALSVSVRTVRRYIARGMPMVMICRRRYFEPDTIAAWLREICRTAKAVQPQLDRPPAATRGAARAEGMARGNGVKPPGPRRQETPAERAVREARVAHEQAEQQRIRDAEIAAELAEESDKARAIIAETIDWDGTPAWRNWHVVRAIPEAAADRSAVLRWHPARRALIAIATDDAGVPTSGQMIMVRPDGAIVPVIPKLASVQSDFGFPAGGPPRMTP